MEKNTIKARVLVAFTCGDQRLSPNDIAILTAKDAKTYAANVDTAAEAIAAAASEGGKEIDLTPKAEAPQKS